MTVTQAADGRKGIEALLSAEDTDLILMDVMMPELDGYATMTKIRQMPASRAGTRGHPADVSRLVEQSPRLA
jgi:CheY-like chemotaxis protein